MFIRNLFSFFIVFFLFGCVKEKEPPENHFSPHVQAPGFPKRKEHRLYHIMVTTENEAKKVLESLENGKNFKEIAMKMSIAPSKEVGGDEGFVPLDILPSPMKEKLIALKSREYTKEAIRTDHGFHIFKVAESRDIIKENNIVGTVALTKEYNAEIKKKEYKEYDAEANKWFEKNKLEIRKLAVIEKLYNDTDERLFFKLLVKAKEWLNENDINFKKLLDAIPIPEKNCFTHKECRQDSINSAQRSYETLGIHPLIIRVMLDYFQAMFSMFDEKIGSANLNSHESDTLSSCFVFSPSNMLCGCLMLIKLKTELKKIDKKSYIKMWKYLSS